MILTRTLKLIVTALAAAASPIAEVPISIQTPNPTITSTHPHAHPTATCTTTLTEYLSGFRGDFQPSIAWTVYIHTHISVTQVDCSGCALAITTQLGHPYGGLGPEEIITATVTATGSTTVISTVCARSTDHDAIPGDEIVPVFREGIHAVRGRRMADQGRREATVARQGVFEAKVKRAVAATTPPPRPTKSVTSTRTSTITLG